jgi:hypothetical protein
MNPFGSSPWQCLIGDQLRLEVAVPVARDFNRQFAEFALQRPKLSFEPTSEPMAADPPIAAVGDAALQ